MRIVAVESVRAAEGPTVTDAHVEQQGFQGFSRDAIAFLGELAANNDRAWFQPRKAEYERLLKRPLEALCVALAERFASRHVPLVADAARSPFRIYRDVRFSRDKSPYKPYASASFPWAGDAASGLRPAPTTPAESHRALGRNGGAGYFHFAPGDVFVGGGMWHPDVSVLRAWRTLVDREPARVHAALDDASFVREFGRLDGDRSVRVPPGFPADHPDADLLRLRDLTFGRRLSDDDVLSTALPDVLADAFSTAVPVFRLLADVASAAT